MHGKHRVHEHGTPADIIRLPQDMRLVRGLSRSLGYQQLLWEVVDTQRKLHLSRPSRKHAGALKL